MKLNKNLKIIAAACAGLSFAAPVWAAEPFVIRDIRIEGLERTEPATIFTYLPVKIGDTFTDTKGEQIIKNLYATGFFDDIQVETLNSQVLLTVTERPIISSLTVTGGKTISNSDIQKSLAQMGLAQARVYDPVTLSYAVEGLKQEYISRGKNSVQVEQKIIPLERNRVAVELAISEGDTTVIRNIDFEGNEFFSDRRLRRQMKLSEKGTLTWFTKSDRFSSDKFSGDLQNIAELYHNSGFFDFRITGTDVRPNEKRPNDLDLVVTVAEGERYRWGEVSLAGDSREVPMEELRKLVKIRSGRWYDRSLLEEATQSIADRMGNEGYALTEVQIQPKVDKENATLDFTLFIVPNQKIYVNEIHISGNNKTRDEVVRREIRQMESAAFDKSKIERSKERIQQLGYFDQVEVTPVPVEGTPDQIDLDVTMKEQSTGSLSVSVGYAQDDGLVLAGGIAQDNLFGTGKSASLNVSNGSSSKIAALSFTDPYFTPDGVSLGYDVFWRSYDPNKIDVSAYKTRTYGAGVRMGVPVTEYDRVNFGLGVNNMKISLFHNSPQRYRDFVKKYGDENWTITGNVGWGRNTTDSTFWPTRGYIINANLEAGLPGGDIQYYKLTHGQTWFFPMTRDLTLMLTGNVGYADGYSKTSDLPFFHNFYGGGLGSVRGYETGSIGPKSKDAYSNNDFLGGTKQANLSAELLFPMPGMKDDRTIRLSLFADAGSVWDGKTYTVADNSGYAGGHHSTFKNELRYSAGLAFTWISPLGPMKFSYAYPINEKKGDELQRFQFQLGTVF